MHAFVCDHNLKSTIHNSPNQLTHYSSWPAGVLCQQERQHHRAEQGGRRLPGEAEGQQGRESEEAHHGSLAYRVQATVRQEEISGGQILTAES